MTAKRYAIYEVGQPFPFRLIGDNAWDVREAELRRILELWVSELEPCVMYDVSGRLLGLGVDVPVGVESPVVIPVSNDYKQWEQELFILWNDTPYDRKLTTRPR